MVWMFLCQHMARDPVESAEDLFEDIIRDMYQLSDTQSQGYITREEFVQVSPRMYASSAVLLLSSS